VIQFDNVSKAYGDRHAVIDLNLSVGQGEFVVLIGPSGSGKSTTLRMINRLVEHDRGRIRFAGREIRDFTPEDLRRRMGYAIQSVGLFPHWTVEKNIGTVPRLLAWPKNKIGARVHELLELLQLPPSEFAKRYPHELSGGQQQRVGVARALAADPEILLMDEPFGALDPVTRILLQRELKRIHALASKTIVMVTHDIDEALFLADRVVLFKDGRLVQDGSPLDILSHPANDFVVDFLGRAELGIKRLGLGSVREFLRAGDQARGQAISVDLSLREALSAFIVQGQAVLPVVNTNGSFAGELHFSDLLQPLQNPPGDRGDPT
jgi:osmoprotectant transport system ATP-binding protein